MAVVVFDFPFDITLGGGCVGFGGDCGCGGGDDEEDAPVSAGAALDGFGAAFAFADGFGAALDGFGAAVDGLTFAGAGGGGDGGADEGDASISSGVSFSFFFVIFVNLQRYTSFTGRFSTSSALASFVFGWCCILGCCL